MAQGNSGADGSAASASVSAPAAFTAIASSLRVFLLFNFVLFVPTLGNTSQRFCLPALTHTSSILASAGTSAFASAYSSSSASVGMYPYQDLSTVKMVSTRTVPMPLSDLGTIRMAGRETFSWRAERILPFRLGRALPSRAGGGVVLFALDRDDAEQDGAEDEDEYEWEAAAASRAVPQRKTALLFDAAADVSAIHLASKTSTTNPETNSTTRAPSQEKERRSFVLESMLAVGGACGAAAALRPSPSEASASSGAEKDTVASTAPPPSSLSRENARGIVDPSEVSRRLRLVPTFAIVDRRGVPYMVFGEDAKLTSYFFVTYGEANRILNLAKQSSNVARAALKEELKLSRRNEKDKRRDRAMNQEGKKQEEEEELEQVGPNPWDGARISTVPLDFAVALATRSTRGAYFRVAPAVEDVEDALQLDGMATTNGIDDFPEGKVPLFYFENFKIPASDAPPGFMSRSKMTTEVANVPTTMVSPLYFRKSEAISAWTKRHDATTKEKRKRNRRNKKVMESMEQVVENDEEEEETMPQVKVTELFVVLTEMVRPGGTDEELGELVFVPPAESASREKECRRVGGKEEPYVIGERIVVL